MAQTPTNLYGADSAHATGQTFGMRSHEPTGRIAGRYEILEVLGRGGMGEVCAGLDRQLDRPVAIKFLRVDLADQTALRDRFQREARAAARMSHPNVVSVFDIGEHEGIPYIVMERLSGRTLADELAAGPLAEPRVRVIAAELLGALSAAHRLGVLHRDIKPGNILLTDTAQVKVGDFGIAKLAEDRHDTTVGSVFGTVSYLAPERLAGRPATRASDVYSAGVVLFEALTGTSAFRGDTPLALARAVAHDEPTFTSAQRDQLDPALVAAVERAMHKDPDARYPTADAMAAAMSGSSGSVPTERAPAERAPAVPAPAAAPLPPTVPVASDPRRASSRDAAPPPAPHDTDIAPTSVLTTDVRPGAARRPRWSRAGAGIVGVVAAGLLGFAGVVAWRDGGGTPITNAPAANAPSNPVPPADESAGSGSIPAPLARAIDELDRAAR